MADRSLSEGGGRDEAAPERAGDETTGTAANAGKHLEIEVDGARYLRIPVRTRVMLRGDELEAFIEEYATPHVHDGDTVFISEKLVAIAQGRAYPISEVTARPLARRLSRYVTRTSYGIGIGMPETMEMAIREAGTARILLAAGVSVLGKLIGRSGDFYRVAGDRVRGIDGPTPGTIPPYNEQVVLVPLDPAGVAERLKGAFALAGRVVEVAIVDANDIGVNVLGTTLDREGEARLARVIGDNPLGQGHESTPIGIIRAA